MKTYILLFQCRDQKGIVAGVSDFIFRHNGNIVTADQHSTGPQGGDFFIRVEFVIDGDSQEKSVLESDLSAIAAKFKAEFKIYDRDDLLNMGIFVSGPDHCLYDLIYLWRSGEIKVNIPFVASNHETHKQFVEQMGLLFYFVPANKKDRREPELLSIAVKSDFLVLARYMLILSKEFLKAYGKDIINIHHGFLPSFKGASPYKQALKQGVKVIGATSHFVTEKLDEGPIIAQSVEHVSHKDDLESLMRKGKNLEKRSLQDAVSAYVDHRIIKHNEKTVVF